MTSDRKLPSAAVWITAALVAVLVGYPLSFGPACWIVKEMGYRDWMPRHEDVRRRLFTLIYGPIQELQLDGPPPIRDAIDWYARFWQ